MFGCFPIGGFGFIGGCYNNVWGRPIVPFGRCCFGPNIVFAGNPFFFGGQHPFIQDNLTLQYKLFNKLGLIG